MKKEKEIVITDRPSEGYKSILRVGHSVNGKVVKNTEDRYSHGWLNGRIEVFQWINPMTGCWANPMISITSSTIPYDALKRYTDCMLAAQEVVNRLLERVGKVGSPLQLDNNERTG